MIKNEEKVLKKLNIKNWKQLDKNHVAKLSLWYEKISPKTLQEIVDKIPDFYNLIKATAKDCYAICSEAMSYNRMSTEKFYGLCQPAMDAITKLLEDKDLNAEQKCELVKTMKEIIILAKDHDQNGNRFNWRYICIWGCVACAVGATAYFAVKFLLPENDGEEEDDYAEDEEVYV